MIRYALHCTDCTTRFDGWFHDSKSCTDQLAAGAVACASCGGSHVEKALMAPGVSTAGSDKKQGKVSADRKATMARMASQMVEEIRQKVEEQCDYVGDQFAEEARKIHYGETEERGIYGEASDDQHKELVDEGIEVYRLPWPKRHKH